MARREQHERIRYFQPHGGQEEFLRLITEPGAFIVISGAGNGWGKSELLVAIFASIMWPKIASAAFAHPFFSEWKYPKRARIYSKPAELEEIGSLQAAIAKLFPKDRYTSSKGKYSYPSKFKTDTGWDLDLFSYERHESEAAGPNIGLQGFNEPPPQPLWKEAIARSRSGGVILGGMTSLQDNPWIVDGVLYKHNGKDIRVRYGDVCENCKQHGKNGHLEHDQIEKILGQYDPDEREARKSGKPLSLSGAIYRGFNRQAHVSEQEIVPRDSGVAHYNVVDPAIGKPLAIIWSQVDVTGTIQVYDEWPEFDFEGSKDGNLTVKEYAELIRGREGNRGIQTRILDRHFGNVRRTLGGLTLKQEFGEVGLEFIDSYHVAENVAEVETGIMKVRDYLRYDRTKPIDGLNRPKLIISPKCRNTIAALERWGRNPDTGKPQEEYKDFCDVVRYLVMANPAIEIDRPWNQGRGAAYGVGT